MTYVLFKRVGIGNRNRCSREDTMDPFFTIDKRTTRRTTRRWSDPVRDLTMPVHGTGSDRPELIQSIGSFNKAESSAPCSCAHCGGKRVDVDGGAHVPRKDCC